MFVWLCTMTAENFSYLFLNHRTFFHWRCWSTACYSHLRDKEIFMKEITIWNLIYVTMFRKYAYIILVEGCLPSPINWEGVRFFTIFTTISLNKNLKIILFAKFPRTNVSDKLRLQLLFAFVGGNLKIIDILSMHSSLHLIGF